MIEFGKALVIAATIYLSIMAGIWLALYLLDKVEVM